MTGTVSLCVIVDSQAEFVSSLFGCSNKSVTEPLQSLPFRKPPAF
jgi:hypothetical protein